MYIQFLARLNYYVKNILTWLTSLHYKTPKKSLNPIPFFLVHKRRKEEAVVPKRHLSFAMFSLAFSLFRSPSLSGNYANEEERCSRALPLLSVPLARSFEGCSISIHTTGLRKKLVLFPTPYLHFFLLLSAIACGYYLFNIFVIASLSLTTNYVLHYVHCSQQNLNLSFGFSTANSITHQATAGRPRSVIPLSADPFNRYFKTLIKYDW